MRSGLGQEERALVRRRDHAHVRLAEEAIAGRGVRRPPRDGFAAQTFIRESIRIPNCGPEKKAKNAVAIEVRGHKLPTPEGAGSLPQKRGSQC